MAHWQLFIRDYELGIILGKDFSKQLSKQIGENLLVAKLGELGIVASTLTGNVPDIDILAYRQDGKSIPIQVKTVRKGSVSVGNAEHFIKISFDETTNPPKIIQKVRGKQKINKDLIYVVIFCRKELEAAKFYICTQGDIQKIVDKNYRAHLFKVDSVRPKNPKSTHCTYKEKDLLKFEDNWDLILKT